MSLLKNKKFLTAAIILTLFGILYYRFGSDLFVGIAVIIGAFLVFLIIGFLNTETGQELIGMAIGAVIIIGILYFLFGKFLIPIALGGLALIIVPTIKRMQNEKKAKAELHNNIQAKYNAIKQISENGYFKEIFKKRMVAFEANPEEIQNTEIDWPGEAKPLWLTLDKQYAFFNKNADRIDEFDINDKKYRDILRNKSYIYNQLSKSAYIGPLKNLFEEYNFDINKTLHSVLDSLYRYNNFYYEEKNNFYKEYGIIKSGIKGEQRVNEELEIFKDVIWNLPNIRLEYEDTSVESDNILITEKGVFSVEVKNFGEGGGYSLIISKDGQWLKQFENGKVEPMKNVASQVNRHIGIKQSFLNDELKKVLNDPDLPYVKIYPIIVIGNDKVLIQNESDLPIMRPSSIYHYIDGFDGIDLDRKYWQVIKEIFETHSLKSKPYPINVNIEGIEVAHRQVWEKIKACYAFYSMLLTFEEDLNYAGISLKEDEKFNIKTFNPNITPKDISEYESLEIKSLSDLIGEE